MGIFLRNTQNIQYCRNSNQIMHSDKHQQMFVMGCPQMYVPNKSNMATGRYLTMVNYCISASVSQILIKFSVTHIGPRIFASRYKF